MFFIWVTSDNLMFVEQENRRRSTFWGLHICARPEKTDVSQLEGGALEKDTNVNCKS